MIGTIHFSAGFAPPSGMLQPGGYQIPPPQNLFSGVGGHQPSSVPSQLQQGMTKCVPALLCCFNTNGHFFWLTFTTTSVRKGPFHFFFSSHLSMHVPCNNHCRTEWVRKLRLVIQNPSHHNIWLFFRICPTFWCAACKCVPESSSSTYVCGRLRGGGWNKFCWRLGGGGGNWFKSATKGRKDTSGNTWP